MSGICSFAYIHKKSRPRQTLHGLALGYVHSVIPSTISKPPPGCTLFSNTVYSNWSLSSHFDLPIKVISQDESEISAEDEHWIVQCWTLFQPILSTMKRNILYKENNLDHLSRPLKFRNEIWLTSMLNWVYYCIQNIFCVQIEKARWGDLKLGKTRIIKSI